MLTIQLLLLLIFAAALIKVFGQAKRQEISAGTAMLWTVFWLLAGYIVVRPNDTFYLAKALGVGRGADAVVYLALALIFFMLFRLTIKVEKINRDITKVVRKESLDEKK
ncbi:MAG: DUF2304 domain-containing protein [Patescibacteria group bacterium]